jgi:sugar/nucleoside kinase (ribokinase family)
MLQKIENLPSPRVVIVGSVAADSLTTYLEPFNINGKNRAAPGMTDIVMGGGAGNCAQALSRINEVLPGPKAAITIITELGKAVPGQITDKIGHEVVEHHLTERNIECIDIARGACAVAFNTVVEHSDGRLIFTQDTSAFPKELKTDAAELIESALKGADYVLLGSSKPHISLMAARAAKRQGVTVLTDWDNNLWPSNEEASAICEEILALSDIIMVPSDTVVKGMPNKTENPDELFTRLQSQYGAKNILLSNGGEDVRALVNGVEHIIPVSAHTGRMFALAAGDHRNAMLLHALAQGHEPLAAFRQATAFASLKIKHPRFDWVYHTHELSTHPAFAVNDNTAPQAAAPSLESL